MLQEEKEKEFVEEKNSTEIVRFIGFSKPLEYLQAADLLVMPLINEGLSISALEAMATGLACLFTFVPGLKDFNREGIDNISYCELNDTRIEKLLAEKIQQGNRSNSINQNKAIKAIYGIDQGVKAYEKIYWS